ncbi:MAG TPA: hypothetical protein VHE35_08950 [Kofleriaceae bacterium]|nr:hypothetical protein [Kofleriaceae bacterium]
MRVTVRAVLALAASLCTAVVVPARVAHAIPYETFIDVDSEDDLYDLLATEQISSDTFEILRTLLARGVDLDRADREEIYSLPNLTYDDVDAILAYRKTQGYIGDPANLVASGTISEEKLLSIAAFLVVRSRGRSPFQPRGWVRLLARGASGDDRVPALALRTRMFAGRRLTAGLATALTRLRVGAPTWDPNRNGLLADDVSPRLAVPKFYVRYRGDHLDMIAGSYRAGFGERLTFDDSFDYTPDGLYIDDQLTREDALVRRCRTSTGELSASPCADDYHYVTPDYHWSEGLRGVAVGTDHLAAGNGYVTGYGFASYAPRPIYQYELVNRAACPDPRDDSNPACGAPPVYIRPDGGDPLAPAAVATFATLPDMYAEALLGGNLTFHATRRNYLGVTGYGASTQWLVDTPADVQLDTQEWSRVPIGGRYGAVGVNAGIGHGIYDIFAEVTRSFDRMPKGPDPLDGGGGPAAVVRVTRTLRHRELELSLRYYDPNFVNPYAGSIAEPDELEGQRNRGEHGVRVRYTGTHGALTVHSEVDLWRALANTDAESAYEYVPRLDVDLRGDVVGSERFGYGLGVHYQDKDLTTTGGDQCYEIVFEDDENGEPIACRGSKLSTIARVRYAPDRKTLLTAQVLHAILDDQHTPDTWRQDVTAVGTAVWRPRADLRLQARVRYRNLDVTDNTYLEQSLATLVEATMRLRKKDQLSVRADVIKFLDDRDSTLRRQPSPEVWLTVGYQANY